MKEIDFLPEWYKSGRRRQISYRTQYIALAGVFAVMLLWNFTSLNSVSKATAELAQMTSIQSKSQNTSKEFLEVKNMMAELREKAHVIEEIDSKIDVASVLAEMSFLIDEKIVLSKVEFNSEKFLENRQGQSSGVSVVRVAKVAGSQQQEMPLGGVRFKVVIYGMAADASDVAALVCKLEDSPYFCQVYFLFSRNITINAIEGQMDSKIQKTLIPDVIKTEGDLTSNNYQVSEFKISFYIANYRQDES